MEINGPSRAEEFINAFLVPFSRGHRISKEGGRVLLGRVVLDLAEGYARLPSGLHPNHRVIIEELLPALE